MRVERWVVLLVISVVATSSSQTDALCTITRLLSDGSTQESFSVFVGSTVDVCAVAPNCSICYLVEVNGNHFTCHNYTVDGLLVASYTLSPVQDQTVTFYFLCTEGPKISRTLISVQDVKISNINITQGCDGVGVEWESPLTTSYRIRVNCDGRWCFVGNSSHKSTFIKLEDCVDLGNCTLFVSAVTSAGLGPEEVKPFAFYSHPAGSIIGQDFWIKQMEDGAGIIYNLTTVGPYCASKFPTRIITHVDEFHYDNVVNVTAKFNPRETVVAVLRKHLHKTKVMVIASNPAGDTNISKFYDTYETISVWVEHTSVPGQVELGCVFAEGSTGNGCFLEVEGQESMYLERNGLQASTEYSISHSGEHNLTAFDWDDDIFGPVFTRRFTISEDPTEGSVVTEEPKSGHTTLYIVVGIAVALALIFIIVTAVLSCHLCVTRNRKKTCVVGEPAATTTPGGTERPPLPNRDIELVQFSSASAPTQVTGRAPTNESSTTYGDEHAPLLSKKNRLPPCGDEDPQAPTFAKETAFTGGSDEPANDLSATKRSVRPLENIAPQTHRRQPKEAPSDILDPKHINVTEPDVAIVVAPKETFNPSHVPDVCQEDEDTYLTRPDEQRSSNQNGRTQLVMEESSIPV